MRALFIVVVLAHFAGLSNPFRIHFGRPSFVHFGYIRSSNLFAKDNKAIDGIFVSSQRMYSMYFGLSITTFYVAYR
jgi:hypothetical protein